MHAKPPAGIAIVLGPPEMEHPDFNGPGFLAAKKQLIMAPEPSPEPPALSPDEHMDEIHAELMEIADQLEAASEKHAGQANRIREICNKMSKKAAPEYGAAKNLD